MGPATTSRRSGVRLLAVLALVALVSACGGEPDEAGFEPVTDEAGFTVTIEEPGAEPRRQLRLGVTAGDTDQVVQRSEAEVEGEHRGRIQTVTEPPTEIDISYAVDQASDHRFQVHGTYDDIRILGTPGVDPTTLETTRLGLQGLENATITVDYTRRGSVIDVEYDDLDVPDELGDVETVFVDSLNDNAHTLSTPFPVQAVGVGARWRVETSATIVGLPVEVTTIVELEELADVRAAGTIQQHLQLVPGPVEVSGTTAEIVDGEFSGEGTVAWNLDDHVLPRSDVTFDGSSTLRIDGTEITQSQRLREVVRSR